MIVDQVKHEPQDADQRKRAGGAKAKVPVVGAAVTVQFQADDETQGQRHDELLQQGRKNRKIE